ncbi:MAG: hypothetical protein GF368_03380 [Candidatus Aenigmarchaeota archaeon]|nr:hypothetical protein [Candidatus Aenigmarchaeota archaeon]
MVVINEVQVPMEEFNRGLVRCPVRPDIVIYMTFISSLGPGGEFNGPRYNPVLRFLVGNPVTDGSWITSEVRERYG